MDTVEKIRNFLTKLQSLPENKKVIIMWAIVAIIGLPMLFFWGRGVVNFLVNFKFKL